MKSPSAKYHILAQAFPHASKITCDNCKNQKGDVVQWMSHTVVLEILSRIRQCVIYADEK